MAAENIACIVVAVIALLIGWVQNHGGIRGGVSQELYCAAYRAIKERKRPDGASQIKLERGDA